MKIAKDKSSVWTTDHQISAAWSAGGTPANIPQCHHPRILGCYFHLRGTTSPQQVKMQDLVATVKSRCQRISRLPLPRPLRANMASVMSIPKALYAPVGYGMNGDQERSVTTQLSVATGSLVTSTTSKPVRSNTCSIAINTDTTTQQRDWLHYYKWQNAITTMTQLVVSCKSRPSATSPSPSSDHWAR